MSDIMNRQIETPENLDRELRDFVLLISGYVEEPQAWPLTHQEQANFIRHIAWRNQRIRNSEPFRSACALAAIKQYNEDSSKLDAEIAAASLKQAKKRSKK